MTNAPHLSVTVVLRQWSVIQSHYQIALDTGGSFIVGRLTINNLEQAQSRCITGNTKYGTVSHSSLVRLGPGTYTFRVQVRTLLALYRHVHIQC